MKTRLNLMLLCLGMVLGAMCFVSCSDDESSSSSPLVGTWERNSSNFLEFNKNGTFTDLYIEEENFDGTLKSTNKKKGTWNYNSSTQTLTMIYSDYNRVYLVLDVNGNNLSLMDINHGETFAYSKSQYKIEDINTVDYEEMIMGVWINKDANEVLQIDDSEATFYILSSKNSNEYIEKTESYYSFYPQDGKLYTDYDCFKLYYLSETKMVMVRNNSNLSYIRGMETDIPNKIDFEGMLAGHSWSFRDKSGSYGGYFNLKSDGTVFFNMISKVYVHGEKPYLTAKGTYTFNGDNANCYFNEVDWNHGDKSEYANIFPGWTYNQPCNMTFTFTEELDDIYITLPDGTQYKLKLIW